MKTLMVRKNVRYDVAIAALVRVEEDVSDMVRLSSSASVRDGWMEVDCVDASLGGLGFVTTTFLPRQTRVKARLLSPVNTGEVLVECACVVRRIIMTDRRPAYHLGCSFGDLSPETQIKLEAILASVGEG